MSRDFPKSDLGSNFGLLPIQKLSKTSQNSVYYSQYLYSIFWWTFHENLNKTAKLQIHENLHINVNENMLSFTILCKFSWSLWRANEATNMLQLYTANINLFKMAVQYKFSPILMVQIHFPKFNRPHFITDFHITWSCCDSQICLPWNVTKES